MTTTAEKIVRSEEKPTANKRPALGRGLDSLLPGGPRIITGATTAPAAPLSLTTCMSVMGSLLLVFGSDLALGPERLYSNATEGLISGKKRT